MKLSFLYPCILSSCPFIPLIHRMSSKSVPSEVTSIKYKKWLCYISPNVCTLTCGPLYMWQWIGNLYNLYYTTIAYSSVAGMLTKQSLSKIRFLNTRYPISIKIVILHCIGKYFSTCKYLKGMEFVIVCEIFASVSCFRCTWERLRRKKAGFVDRGSCVFCYNHCYTAFVFTQITEPSICSTI